MSLKKHFQITLTSLIGQYVKTCSRNEICLRDHHHIFPVKDVVMHLSKSLTAGDLVIFQMCRFQTYIKDRYFEHLLWNCPEVAAIRSHRLLVDNGSENCVLSSGNWALPKPILTHIYVAMWYHKPVKSELRPGQVQVLQPIEYYYPSVPTHWNPLILTQIHLCLQYLASPSLKMEM